MTTSMYQPQVGDLIFLAESFAGPIMVTWSKGGWFKGVDTQTGKSFPWAAVDDVLVQGQLYDFDEMDAFMTFDDEVEQVIHQGVVKCGQALVRRQTTYTTRRRRCVMSCAIPGRHIVGS